MPSTVAGPILATPLAPLAALPRTQFTSTALRTLTQGPPLPASQKLKAYFNPRFSATDLQTIGAKTIEGVAAASDTVMKVRLADGAVLLVRRQGLFATVAVTRLLAQAILDTVRKPDRVLNPLTGRLTAEFIPALNARLLTLLQSKIADATAGLKLQLASYIERLQAGTLRLDLEALDLLSALELEVIDQANQYLFDRFDVSVMIADIKNLAIVGGGHAEPYDPDVMGGTMQNGYFDDGSMSYTVLNHYHPAAGGNVPTTVTFTVDARNGVRSGSSYEIQYGEDGEDLGAVEVKDNDTNDNGVNDSSDPTMNTDNDELTNDKDKDDDNDGVPDSRDNYPQDNTKSIIWEKEVTLVQRFVRLYANYFRSDEFLSLYSRFLGNELALSDFAVQVRTRLRPLILLRT